MYQLMAILFLSVSLLSGCGIIKQVVHEFPQEGQGKMGACDECFEFQFQSANVDSKYELVKAPKNTIRSFAYEIQEPNVERSRLLKIIKGVEISQEANLTYNNHQYLFEGIYSDQPLQESMTQVRIIQKLEKGTKITDIARIDSAGSIAADIDQVQLVYQALDDWGGENVSRKENGENVWHYYPEGFFGIIKQNGIVVAKLLKGAKRVKFMGMDAYSGSKYQLQVLHAPLAAELERMIVFLTAALFAEGFYESIEFIEFCAGLNKNDREANECS